MAEVTADMPEGAVTEVTADADGAVTGNLQAAKNSDSMDEKQRIIAYCCPFVFIFSKDGLFCFSISVSSRSCSASSMLSSAPDASLPAFSIVYDSPGTGQSVSADLQRCGLRDRRKIRGRAGTGWALLFFYKCLFPILFCFFHAVLCTGRLIAAYSGLASLLLIHIPLVLGNLFQLTYNAADSVIVGKYVGEQALAAVGTSTPIMNIAILLISGMCMGASVLMSSQYGAKISVPGK